MTTGNILLDIAVALSPFAIVPALFVGYLELVCWLDDRR